MAEKQSRTFYCLHCGTETAHEWRQWRHWLPRIWRHAPWLEGWACARCGTRRFVWQVRLARR